MTDSFQFVDETQPGEVSRKLIRSHCMKGRNVGKTFHRPSKVKRRPRSNINENEEQRSQAVVQRARFSIHELFFSMKPKDSPHFSMVAAAVPLRLTPSSRKVINTYFEHVIDKMYPPTLRLSTEGVKHGLLTVLCSDAAAFHCTIAVMGACNEFFGARMTSPEVMYHHSKTLELLGTRLKGKKALSESTVAIILLVVIQEQVRKDEAQARVHYEGLRQLIEMRGGLSTLEQNLPLILKICKTDITYAMQFGTPTVFWRDRIFEVQTALALRGLYPRATTLTSELSEGALSPELYHVFLDVAGLASMINSMPPYQNMDANLFVDMVVSISYRLIRFHPILDTKEIPDIEAVYHIGLTIFVMTLYLQHNKNRISRFELVTSRFKDVLCRGLGSIDEDLILWLVFVGGIWILEDEEETWLMLKIRRLTRQRNINTWEEVLKAISQYPWIHPFHDKLGRALWDAVCSTTLEFYG